MGQIRNPMLYPFELRTPGSGNRNFHKGFQQSVVWGTTSEVPAQPQYRTASERRRVQAAFATGPLRRLERLSSASTTYSNPCWKQAADG
jgi:hypothetical protein